MDAMRVVKELKSQKTPATRRDLSDEVSSARAPGEAPPGPRSRRVRRYDVSMVFVWWTYICVAPPHRRPASPEAAVPQHPPPNAPFHGGPVANRDLLRHLGVPHMLLRLMQQPFTDAPPRPPHSPSAGAVAHTPWGQCGA